MALRLILGRAGTGKTRRCIDAVKDAIINGGSGKVVFLVPEQATYQIEKQILADDRIDGYSDAYIISFSRLGFWLIDRQTSLEPLTKSAKYMIISRVLRENKDKLKVFGQMANEPGMVSKLVDIIGELYRCGKGSADLSQIAQIGIDNSLSVQISLNKFADISLIYERYVDFITGRFENPDAQLANVRELIAKSDVFSGCHLWVDGFSGFTYAEYEVLSELMKVCSDAEITLCIDTKAGLRGDVFTPALSTKEKIETIAKDNNIEVLEPVVLSENHRFKDSKHLKHLEENLFALKAEKITAENIKIVSPLNISAEVEYIASQINELVYKDKLRYRDIAIILSDVEAYQPYLRQIFADYNLPYFLDTRRSCAGHPLLRMLLSAIRILERGFERVDVFSYLKSGFADLDSFDIDILDNYCRLKGVGTQQWLSNDSWRADCQQDFPIDKIRRKASKDILWLKNNIAEKMKAKKFADVLVEFLSRLKVADTLAQWQQQVQTNGNHSSEHNQVYSQVFEILGEIKSVFGDDELDKSVLLGSFADSLGSITTSLIPPGQDEIMISQIERSRHPELKAVFIAGALAKKFPITMGNNSILSDSDREFALQNGVELEEGSIEKIDKCNYLAYIALTRASDKLWITYPRVGTDGKKQHPSDIIGAVKNLFTDLEVETSLQDESLERITSLNRLKDYICINGGRSSYAKYNGRDIKPLIEVIEKDDSLNKTLFALNKACEYKNGASLDLPMGGIDEKGRLSVSVSKLKCYAACPYQYFAKYALGLKPEEKFEYTALGKGDFYHKVLQFVSGELIDRGIGFGDVEAKELKDIAEKKIAYILEQDSKLAELAASSKHNEFIFKKMKEEIIEFIRSLRLMAKVSDFKLCFSELESKDDFVLKALNGRQVVVRSKIDRIDIDSSNAAVVYDYKSSKNVGFDWYEFYYGLDLQLPVYILCANNLSEKVGIASNAMAAFYVPIGAKKEPKQRLCDELGDISVRKARGLYNEDCALNLDNSIDDGQASVFYAIGLKKKGGFNVTASGDLLSPKEFDSAISFAKSKIISISECILKGVITISPYKDNKQSACKYCDYKPLCRFDRDINRFNILANWGGGRKKKKFFEIIGQGGLL